MFYYLKLQKTHFIQLKKKKKKKKRKKKGNKIKINQNTNSVMHVNKSLWSSVHTQKFDFFFLFCVITLDKNFFFTKINLFMGTATR